MGFGWLQVHEFMTLCPCNLVFVLEPVHSQESERTVFVRKGFLPVGYGHLRLVLRKTFGTWRRGLRTIGA